MYVVEGMQFERGFFSPYFVTDPERMATEFENCSILLVDKKITSAKDIILFLENTVKTNKPLLIMAEEFEQEPLAMMVVNRIKGNLKVVAVKAPGFGDRKTSYLEDIAILTGGTLVKDELGVSLDKAGEEVLGNAAKVVVTKEICTIVGDGTTQDEVEARVKQIKTLLENTD